MRQLSSQHSESLENVKHPSASYFENVSNPFSASNLFKHASLSPRVRMKPAIANVKKSPVYRPSSSICPTLSCTEPCSFAGINRFVAEHLRGMYRSTILPSSFCIAGGCYLRGAAGSDYL